MDFGLYLFLYQNFHRGLLGLGRCILSSSRCLERLWREPVRGPKVGRCTLMLSREPVRGPK
ncbi:unnamed protein product, partial [Strongylus vulgaris]